MITETYYPVMLASAIAFITTYFITPLFIQFLTSLGITGKDLMKKKKTSIPEMGGPCVLVGFLAGIFYFIGVEIFIFTGLLDPSSLLNLLASISTILIIAIIGMFEVLTSLTKGKGGVEPFKERKRKGISRWLFFVVPLPAAVPLIAVHAGVTTMAVPFFGRVNFGLFYPLVLVPLAVLTVSNATNFLGGFNGLEAGMGTVLLTALGIYSLINERLVAGALALTFASALLAFLRYNWYPAKIFPGDLNYIIGAVTVSVAVIGDIEKFSVLCFIPWILEAFLKLRSKFQAESYGLLQKDGTLKAPYQKIYSLTHLVMKIGGLNERGVSLVLILTEILICVSAFWLCLTII